MTDHLNKKTSIVWTAGKPFGDNEACLQIREARLMYRAVESTYYQTTSFRPMPNWCITTFYFLLLLFYDWRYARNWIAIKFENKFERLD